jgi:hypothetical protein
MIRRAPASLRDALTARMDLLPDPVGPRFQPAIEKPGWLSCRAAPSQGQDQQCPRGTRRADTPSAP